MTPVKAETWWHRSARGLATGTLRVLPIPPAQKWRLAGIAADRLESTVSPSKEVRMASGFRMLLDLGKPYERRSYYSGVYDAHLTRLCKLLLRSGDTVIDGGANIGYMSLLAAKCVGKYGCVHAFEPVPPTFEILQKNIQLNNFSNIRPNRLALAQKAGALCFALPVDACTGKTLDRLATLAQLRDGLRFEVPACTLDEYAASSAITSIRLLKLDLEGGEVGAIAGMRQLLSERRISYLISEFNPPLLDELGIPHSALQVALRKYGYRCYRVHYYVGFARVEYLRLLDTSCENAPDEFGDYLFVAPGLPVPGKQL